MTQRDKEIQPKNNSAPLPPGQKIVTISDDMSEDIQELAIKTQFIYSMLGLSLGFICIIFGVGLFIGGISGTTKITSKVLAEKSAISDTGPGAILFAAGLSIVKTTGFNIKSKMGK